MDPVQVATVLRTCLRSADPTNRTLKVSAKEFKESKGLGVIEYNACIISMVSAATLLVWPARPSHLNTRGPKHPGDLMGQSSQPDYDIVYNYGSLSLGH